MTESNAPLNDKHFLQRFGKFIRFSHTVFALPFALSAMITATEGNLFPPQLVWILGCVIAARTVGMCFNRLVDWDFDKSNPRTADRHTLISKPQGWSILILSAAAAAFCASKLNTLCFALSPLMLALVCFYSLTKRFTAFSHFFIGLALAQAPMGAWAAVRGSLLDAPPILLASGVLLWTFGFDLIYSTLDTQHDQRLGLFSYPSRRGIPSALRLAKTLHAIAALTFIAFGITAKLGAPYHVASTLSAAALLFEHRLAAKADPRAINQAFFTVNAIVSVVLLLGVTLSFALAPAPVAP
jgi:4-hydroxybenzoate polyprenyltransferase